MRLGMLAASGFVGWALLPAVLLASGCTRALDFDALDGDPTGDRGVDGPVTTQPPAGLDGGFSCRLLTPAPAFCDDFDTRPLGDAWSELLAAPADGGTLVQDSRDFVSPPNSLLVGVHKDIPARTYVGMGLHQVLPALAAGHGRIDIDFDMRIEQLDPKPGRDIVAFQLVIGATAAGSQRNQLVLDVRSGSAPGARFNDNVLAASGNIIESLSGDWHAQPAVNRWTHVSFTLQVAPRGGKNQVSLRMGPRESFDTQYVTVYDAALQHELQAGQPLMEVGIPWLSTDDGATAEWRIRYDNVLVTLREE